MGFFDKIFSGLKKTRANLEDLEEIFRNFKPGDVTTVTVFRGRQVLQLRIVLDAKPAPTG